MKVYCGDCKYYKKFKYPKIERCKKVPRKLYNFENYNILASPSILNKNNDCLNYKEKRKSEIWK